MIDRIQLGVITALLRLSALLPLSVARKLGRIAAGLYWPFRARSRRVTEINIAAAFPELSEAERQALAKESVKSTAELFMEMGHIWLKPWAYVEGLILEEHGVEILKEAQAQGRGIIAMAPHLGNWELMGLHVARIGKTVSLFQPPKIKGLGSIMRAARESSGAELVPTTSRGLAQSLRNVKHGGISGILPDQAPTELNSGLNVPFMGIDCFTGTLASNMIRRTGALAIYGFARRVPGGFIVRYVEAEDDIYNEDDAVSLAALNRGVERCLGYCVEQYQWEYKRFRVRPSQGKGLYDKM